ncbi:MAG: methionine synthase [Desulfurococcales archaeon]|nr:methionine synthase [Desulfurococcales archaeon]
MAAYTVPKAFPTTVVGSYPKLPSAREALRRQRKGGISEEEFKKLVREAIRGVIEDYIWAGVDILSDGEQSREDMVVYFAERLRGYAPGEWVRIFDNVYFRKPIIVDKVEWVSPMALDDWEYARSISGGRPVKVILTGPYTMLEWSFDLHYGDRREAILDLARVIRREVDEYLAKGAEYVQIDEPALSTRPWREEAELAGEALEVIFRGVSAKRIVHICFGRIERILPYILDYPVDQFDLEFKNSDFRLLPYLKEYGYDKELGYGVVDVHSLQVESVEEIKKAIDDLMKLDIIGPEKVYIDPDCGLKRLPREIAREKLKNMVEAARLARREWAGEE